MSRWSVGVGPVRVYGGRRRRPSPAGQMLGAVLFVVIAVVFIVAGLMG
jgi:hypothetical protein